MPHTAPSPSRGRPLWFVPLLAVLLLNAPGRADNWPSWRGPTEQGISTEKNLPVEWSAAKNVAWKAPLSGAGVSTPVVWGDRVFLTASDGRRNDQLHILCFHRNDGRQLWHVQLFGTAPTDMYTAGGMAVSTPVTDGKYVYALFGTGDLFCLDFDGRPRWIRSLAQEYGPFRNRWGMGSSPILIDDLLVIQVDHWGQSYLLGIEAPTGKNRWKTDRAVHVNWTSPLPMRVNGRTEIIALGTERAEGYDARTGKRLWSVPGMDEQCVPTPVHHDNLLLVCCERGTQGIRLADSQNKQTAPSVVWKNSRAKSYVASPLYYQGCLYIPQDRGIVTCLDADTGKQLWKERLGGSYRASPVAADGKVYITTLEGTVFVLLAGKEFRVLSRNDLKEDMVASPAVADGAIFLRGEKHLFCIRNAQ